MAISQYLPHAFDMLTQTSLLFNIDSLINKN